MPAVLALLTARVLVFDSRQNYAAGAVGNLIMNGHSTSCDSKGRGTWDKTHDRQEEQDCSS